jgi:hypothetical protein
MNLVLAELSSILLAHNQSQLSLPDSDYCKNLLKKRFLFKKANNIKTMIKKQVYQTGPNVQCLGLGPGQP